MGVRHPGFRSADHLDALGPHISGPDTKTFFFPLHTHVLRGIYFNKLLSLK